MLDNKARIWENTYMDKKTLKKMFKYINRELFDDELDKPKFFFIPKNQKVYPFEIDGYCLGSDRQYIVGLSEGLTTQNYFDTLAHEMMHMHLIETKGYEGHGKPFLKLCEKGIDTFYYKML